MLCFTKGKTLDFFSIVSIRWSLYNDASNAAVLVSREAQAIEGLLGAVFVVVT